MIKNSLGPKQIIPNFEKKNESKKREMLREKDAVKTVLGDFPGGAVVKNPPANAGDTGLSPGPGRSHMPRSN